MATEEKLPFNEEEVRTSLEQIIDPEFDVDIVNLGLVYRVDVQGDSVSIDMTMTDPACPIIDQLILAVKDTIKDDFGITDTRVNIVWQPRWTWEMMTDEAKISLGYPI